MSHAYLNTLVDAYKSAQARNHRLLLVLSGNRKQSLESARCCLRRLNIEDPVYIGVSDSESQDSETVPKAASLLGSDRSAVVYDASGGFDPDAFGILSGTIKGGGLCILITPSLRQWPQFQDPENRRLAVYPYDPGRISGRYLSRLSQIIGKNLHLIDCRDGVELRLLPIESATNTLAHALPTNDQQSVISAIVAMAKNDNSPAPLLLTADRGRGKSSAMGIAAATILLIDDAAKIVLTAPRRSVLNNFMRHAKITLGATNRRQSDLQKLVFFPPDALLNQKPQADILMVDEAAAIPLPLLRKIVICYPKAVFSSTLHGYEGAGRGFSLRFKQMLDKHRPQWQSLTCTTPIRFGENDPLERFTENLLMLDADPEIVERKTKVALTGCEFRTLTADYLLSHENELRDLFALLVQAHYQTKPLDLRHILDGPNIDIHTLNYKGKIIAAVMLAREGVFNDTRLADGIVHGERRPRGHLLPQILAYQYMQAGFLKLRIGRIVRIAVHPLLQNQGLGTHFLGKLQSYAIANDYDALGASFGESRELLSFWQKNRYKTLHLGYHRNVSSGTFSVVNLYPISHKAQKLCKQCRQKFYHLIRRRAEISEQVWQISRIINTEFESPVEEGEAENRLNDKNEILSYCLRARDFDSSRDALTRFFQSKRSQLQNLPDRQAKLIEYVFFRHCNWAAVCEILEIPGRRAGELMIKESITQLL